MAEIKIDQATLDSVKGKRWFLQAGCNNDYISLNRRSYVSPGGAEGMGAATVSQLYQSDAYVYFSDWDESRGSKLAGELQTSQTSDGSVTYLKFNIREYHSLLSFFDTAYNKHGQIDMAICCAAVTERSKYWGPEKLNLQSLREV